MLDFDLNPPPPPPLLSAYRLKSDLFSKKKEKRETGFLYSLVAKIKMGENTGFDRSLLAVVVMI